MRETGRATRDRPKLPRRRSAHDRIATDLAVANRGAERFVSKPDEVRPAWIAYIPRAHLVLRGEQAPHVETPAAGATLKRRNLAVAAVRTKDRASFGHGTVGRDF